MLSKEEQQIAQEHFGIPSRFGISMEGAYAAIEAVKQHVLVQRTDGVTLRIAMAALDKLARLGAQPHYGNSEGNCIALQAIKEIEEALSQRTEQAGIAAGLADVVHGRVKPLSQIEEEQRTEPTPAQPVPQSAGTEDVHNKHWRNPETGEAECECCCGWALDMERERKEYATALAVARKGLHRGAEIQAATAREAEDWPGNTGWGSVFAHNVLARLNAHKQERVMVVGAVVYLDGKEFAAFKGHDSHEPAERCATGLRAELEQHPPQQADGKETR